VNFELELDRPDVVAAAGFWLRNWRPGEKRRTPRPVEEKPCLTKRQASATYPWASLRRASSPSLSLS